MKRKEIVTSRTDVEKRDNEDGEKSYDWMLTNTTLVDIVYGFVNLIHIKTFLFII